jgi:signal transduction histidine kinase
MRRAFLPLTVIVALQVGVTHTWIAAEVFQGRVPMDRNDLVRYFVYSATYTTIFVLIGITWPIRRICGGLDKAEVGRNQALAEARLAREAAETSDQAKSQFLALMSHELRTPLSAIIGYSEMLQEDARKKGWKDLLADLERIRQNGRHLLALINDILDLSKIEAGKMVLDPKEIAVADEVQEVVATVRPLVEKKGNTFTTEVDEGLGRMVVDATRLRQCLLNLLDNAAKFTDNGRVTLTTHRELADGRDWLAFCVGDTGIGMTPEQQQKLYQPFTQADSSTTRRYGGTGLGLAITHQLILLMGGSIEVDSAPGRGTTFTVRLPVALLPAPAAGQVSASAPASA